VGLESVYRATHLTLIAVYIYIYIYICAQCVCILGSPTSMMAGQTIYSIYNYKHIYSIRNIINHSKPIKYRTRAKCIHCIRNKIGIKHSKIVTIILYKSIIHADNVIYYYILASTVRECRTAVAI